MFLLDPFRLCINVEYPTVFPNIDMENPHF